MNWTIAVNGQAWTPTYMLVAGNRRLIAAGEGNSIGSRQIIKADDNERAFILRAVENIHWEGLTAAERARVISILAALRDEAGRPLMQPGRIWLLCPNVA